MQLFRVLVNTINDQSVHELIVMAKSEQDARNIAQGNVKANNPTKGLNTPVASQNNTRVLSAQATNISDCIEVHKFPLAMARDLIGQQF
jgi:hypothetical protein